jgi:hypothetical protein
MPILSNHRSSGGDNAQAFRGTSILFAKTLRHLAWEVFWNAVDGRELCNNSPDVRKATTDVSTL